MSKYVLVFTFPSGKEFVASAQDGCLAMIPVEGDAFKGALCWESKVEISTFLEALKLSIGAEEFKKLLMLKPRAMPCKTELTH